MATPQPDPMPVKRRRWLPNTSETPLGGLHGRFHTPQRVSYHQYEENVKVGATANHGATTAPRRRRRRCCSRRAPLDLTPLTTKPRLITRSTRRQSRRPDNHQATTAPRRRRRRCCSRRAQLDLTPLNTKPHLITRSTRRHNRSPAAVPGPRVRIPVPPYITLCDPTTRG